MDDDELDYFARLQYEQTLLEEQWMQSLQEEEDGND
jgi:hypothetical protein